MNPSISVLLITALLGACGASSDARKFNPKNPGAPQSSSAITPSQQSGTIPSVTPTPVATPAAPYPRVMLTAFQLESLRANIAQEPTTSAFAQLVADANQALQLAPSPDQDFDVPGYYTNKDAHRAAKRNITKDAMGAYALALAFHLDTSPLKQSYGIKAVQYLNAWASQNTSVSGTDGPLVMAYLGTCLIYAADLMMAFDGWSQADRQMFFEWVDGVFKPTVAKLATNSKDVKTNRGAWGALASLAAESLTMNQQGISHWTADIAGRIAANIDENGEFPEENLRTNSGIWYTYFILAPLTTAAHITKNASQQDLFTFVSTNGRSLKMALDRHFYYTLHPDQWPHKLPDGIEGMLLRLQYGCADSLELPQQNSWPSDLFEVMSNLYGEASWAQWSSVSRPHSAAEASWRYATLIRSVIH